MTSSAKRADGAAGARWAAGVFGNATCAQTNHTTMEEDYAKVDMKLSFRHSFQPSKVVTLHAQVKTGKSFRAKSSNATTLCLNFNRETLEALAGTVGVGIVIWVPPRPADRIYWYAADPRAGLRTPAKISRQQYVRPSIGYDLTRLLTYSGWNTSRPHQTFANVSDTTTIMSKAKQGYSDLKSSEWNHPLVGKLAVTRLAWRHITRQSKTTQRRNMALRAVPYLKNFLHRAPDRFVCNYSDIVQIGRREVETRFILCWYRAALTIDGESHSLLLRIKEEISYPEDWASYPLSSSEISQTATLASWWCKKDK